MNLYLLAAKALAVLALLAALVYGWHRFTEHYVEIGRQEVRAAEVEPLQKQIAAARERASALALQWDQQRIKAEAAGKVADDERAKRLTDARDRTRALPAAVAGVVVPAAAADVVRDAIADSNQSATPGPAREPDAPRPAAAADPGDATVGAVTDWAVQVISLYAACRDQVAGWVAFYGGLQSAQPHEQSP